MDRGNFWNRFWLSTVAVYLAGLIFILAIALTYTDQRNLYEFQSDLSAGISGENTQYQRADAEKIANVLREIPEERLDEDFGYMTMISMGYDGGSRANVKDALIFQHPQKLENIVLYYDMVENWSGDDGHDFQDTIENSSTRMALKKALLTGGKVLQFEPPKTLFSSYSLQQNLWILIAICQLIAFVIYCLINWGNREYPLNLPDGIGPKIAMMATFPGNLPLMIPLWLGRKIYLLFIKRPNNSHRGKTKLSDFHAISTQRSRETLRKLKNQIGE